MARLLLIGNSRWHWAESSGNGLRCWHTAPCEGLDPAQQQGLQAWKTLRAQVGSVDLALWLTGGDGPQLMPLLEEQQVRPVLAPDLALEALASLPVVGLLR